MRHLHHHLRTSLHGLNWAHTLIRGQGLSREVAMHLAVADANARLVSSYTELLLEYLEVCGQDESAGAVPVSDLTTGIATDLATATGLTSPVSFEMSTPDLRLAPRSFTRCRYLVRTLIDSTLEGHADARFVIRVSRRVVSPPSSFLVFDIARDEAERRPPALRPLNVAAAPVDELRDLLVDALVEALGGACRRDRRLGTTRLVVPVTEEGLDRLPNASETPCALVTRTRNS
jgi:hypothetical protein